MGLNTASTVATVEVIRAELQHHGIHTLWTDRVIGGVDHVVRTSRGKPVVGLTVKAERSSLKRFSVTCGEMRHTFTRGANQDWAHKKSKKG